MLKRCLSSQMLRLAAKSLTSAQNVTQLACDLHAASRRCYGFVQSALWFQVTLGAMGEEVVPARGLAVRSFTGMRVREVCCKRSRRSNFLSLKAALVSYRANFAELTRGKSDLRSSESSQCDLTPELALLSRSVGPADGAPR